MADNAMLAFAFLMITLSSMEQHIHPLQFVEGKTILNGLAVLPRTAS